MNNPKHLLTTPSKAQNTVLKVTRVALFLLSTGITIRSQTEEPISEPSNYWAIEDAAERAKLPLYKTIPAALPHELTPSNELPPRSDYRDWYRSHGDHYGSRYSGLTQINRSNVDKPKRFINPLKQRGSSSYIAQPSDWH
jgi:glucose dehydrogenase